MIDLELLSVSVGRGVTIGVREGRDVRSAIGKLPVETTTVEVGEDGLVGDQQVARGVHGGPDQAVYAYSADHFEDWATELGTPVRPGLFGENLTITGTTEREVRAGDEWQWGEVRLRVTKRRFPCYKLDMHLGREVGPFMLERQRTGWYLAVIHPGTAPTSGAIEVVARGTGPTIAEEVARETA